MSADARREVIELAATELFAQHGYYEASMAAIARRAGVSVPVLYDHFASKQALHRRLLERHFAELRAVWARHLAGDDGGEPQLRIGAAIDAWFAYVEDHPYACRLLFRETVGDPEVEATRREVAEQSKAALLPLLAREPGIAAAAGSPAALEMYWEVMRAVLQGLALWWYEHPELPRGEVVRTAMNAVWLGLERVEQGETWHP